MTERPTLDEYFMKMAEVASERSTCEKRGYGALLVKDKQVVATGYNGAPRGLPHCDEVGCNREDAAPGEGYNKCRSVHAEQNAIIQGATSSTDISHSTLYVTGFPCLQCVRMILNSKIEKIIYKNKLNRTNDVALELLKDSPVEVIEFKE